MVLIMKSSLDEVKFGLEDDFSTPHFHFHFCFVVCNNFAKIRPGPSYDM